MKKRTWRSILWLSGGGLLVCGALGVWFVLWVLSGLPSVENIDRRQVSQSTKIYDREGTTLLYEISGGQKRTVIPFEEIPQTLKDAVVSIEDEKFYEEPGVSIRGILRAVFANLAAGEIVQGGSTITQQLARNAFLTLDQTFLRKIREAFLAIQLDRRLTKNQVLGLYLNEIPFGPTIYGVEAASQAFFGKPAKELTLAESALIAAIPKAPTYYSPTGNHVKELLARKDLILKKMKELGKISDAQFAEARAVVLVFKPQTQGIAAPHFVTAVQDYLVKKYGEDTVRTGGLVVKTTLDVGLQKIAEKAVKDGATQNTKLYEGHNAALAAINPKTGEVLALVGSKDYFSAPEPAGCVPGSNCKFEPSFNAATQALRQPGSALKPFVYLAGFEKGYTPETIVFDVPTEFVPRNPPCPPIPDFSDKQSEKRGCFHPQNFDDMFRGPISLRRALALSVNIPAVKILYLAGLQDTLDVLSSFGITTLNDPSRFGLSLVLGGGEVRLIELVGAYATLAHDGVRTEPHLVLEIKNRAGMVLESASVTEEKATEPQYARLISQILSDTDARSGLFGSSLPLTVFPGHDVALKTGTTNDYRDAWALGYTPSLAVGVWAGNNDNAPMQRRGSSILAAVPIWSAFLKEALKSEKAESFQRPDPINPGKPVLSGDYLYGKQVHSILYYVDRKDPLGPAPTNPAQDPQFENWELGVLRWAEKNLPEFQTYNQSSSAVFVDGTVNLSLILPQITFRTPLPGSQVGPFVSVNADVISNTPLSLITLYFNGVAVQQVGNIGSKTYTFQWSFPPQVVNDQNFLEIEAVGIDGLKNRTGVVLYR